MVNLCYQSLVAAVHALSGTPSCAPELASLMFANSMFVVQNVFMIEKYVVLLFCYLKSCVLTGKDALIPKALPKSLSQLLILYLTIVQPVLQVFATERWSGDLGKKIKGLYRSFLFVQNGILMMGVAVQNLF